MYGEEFHPLMNMAELAVKLHQRAINSDDNNDIKASIDAWEKIAQYTEPKLKAVEVTGEGGGAVEVKLVKYSD